jgi:hypothetical protein
LRSCRPISTRAYASRETWEQLVLHVVDALQVPA